MEKQKEIVVDFSCWLIWHWVFYINIYHWVLCSHKHHSPHTMHYFTDHRSSQIAVRFQFFFANLNSSREKMPPNLFIILLFSIIVNVLNWRFFGGWLHNMIIITSFHCKEKRIQQLKMIFTNQNRWVIFYSCENNS